MQLKTGNDEGVFTFPADKIPFARQQRHKSKNGSPTFPLCLIDLLLSLYHALFRFAI